MAEPFCWVYNVHFPRVGVGSLVDLRLRASCFLFTLFHAYLLEMHTTIVSLAVIHVLIKVS